jgi:deoxyxylulose-5-phosphate synthase
MGLGLTYLHSWDGHIIGESLINLSEISKFKKKVMILIKTRF